MTLSEFYDELVKHDWYYTMSDDRKVEERGARNLQKLNRIATGNPKFAALLQQYHNYIWSGTPFGTEKAPKPERPTQ